MSRAILFHIACSCTIELNCSLLRISSLFSHSFCLIMPPCPSNRRNRSVSLDPKALTLAELNDLPRNSLILLASARNLVTTGTKTRLAQRIYEHEKANNHTAQADDSVLPTPPALNDNLEVDADAERPSRSRFRQQQASGSLFSRDQLSQLRGLIAEAVGPQLSGFNQADGLPADVPLLSLASPVTNARNNASQQNLRNFIQDGVVSQSQLVPSPPQAPQVSAPLLGTAATQSDLSLSPLPDKLQAKISKREYIDFNELLSENMYPHPSLASAQHNFTLAVDPQDASTLAFVPSQRKKHRIDGLSSWLEAWNVFLRSTLSLFPHLAPDLLAYQAQICKFSRKFKASAWLMYDTAFRYMAASNIYMAWGKVNEQLYNNILKEETLPYCIHCHTYGHRTLGCPSRSKPAQPFRAFSASSFATPSSDTFGSTTAKPPLRNEYSPAAICRDFNRQACRRPNCLFKHVCNKPDCGGNHPGSQCPKVR